MGHLGKPKIRLGGKKSSRFRSAAASAMFTPMRKHVVLSLCTVMWLSSCQIEAQDLVFTGALTPRAGVCDAAARSTLTVRGKSVLFAPTSGVTTLAGRIAPDGTITATAVAPGLDHAPYKLAFTAVHNAENVVGRYLTPRCEYDVRLSRAH